MSGLYVRSWGAAEVDGRAARSSPTPLTGSVMVQPRGFWTPLGPAQGMISFRGPEAPEHICSLRAVKCGREEDAMATSVKQMMEAANAAVPRITPAQAREMIAKGNTLVVDVRDAPEVDKSGKVAGAVNVSRGMLEFRADPESPYHDKNFAKDKTVIVYCASGG